VILQFISSPSARKHVLHPCNTKGKTTILYVLTFTLLDKRRKSRLFVTVANIRRFYSALKFLRMQVWFISVISRYCNPTTLLGILLAVFMLFNFYSKRTLHTYYLWTTVLTGNPCVLCISACVLCISGAYCVFQVRIVYFRCVLCISGAYCVFQMRIVYFRCVLCISGAYCLFQVRIVYFSWCSSLIFYSKEIL
jgi:hypothetical protein